MNKRENHTYIWDEKSECMSRKDLHTIQSKSLTTEIQRIYKTVPFYNSKFDETNIHPNQIHSIDDLPKLPFTTKSDINAYYPLGMLAKACKEIVRIHASSGTTRKPTIVAYTQKDIQLWSEMMARAMATAGIRPGTIVQNAFSYGLFTGGLGFHYGAERIGATLIPISGGNTQRQLTFLQDLGSKVIVCTPSYALFISEVATEQGIDIRHLPITIGIFGAEPWSESMRVAIEVNWGIQAYDIYGLSEVIGPGVAQECSARNGLHVYEDHFIPEVINPDTGEVLAEGELGELVITAVTKEALPLIRYRTGDLTRLFYEPCSCGRTLTRMDRIAGRIDDMVIVRGVNVFPSQIEDILLQFDSITPNYQIVVEPEKRNLDELEIRVEVSESFKKDGCLLNLEKQLVDEITSVLGIRVKLKILPPNTIPRSEGKAKRLVNP